MQFLDQDTRFGFVNPGQEAKTYDAITSSLPLEIKQKKEDSIVVAIFEAFSPNKSEN